MDLAACDDWPVPSFRTF